MLTVVTVTFNNYEEFLQTQASLDAAGDVQRVVVNGGSCEQTRAWLAARPEIISVSEPDRGISDAFNKGVALATGDLVVFLHSGDLLVDGRYYRQAQAHLAAHPEIGFTHCDMFFKDPLAGELRMRPSLRGIGRGMPFWHPTMVVRKSVFARIGGFREDYRIAMDYDWVCRLQRAGITGTYLSEEVCLRMDGGGVSSTQERRALAECWRALRTNDLLSPGVVIGFAERVLLYNLRSALKLLGMTVVLRRIKKLRHGSAALSDTGSTG